MSRAWHRPFAVGTALIVGLVALSLYACGGASQNVDPQAVLKASSAAMKQIKGFHFEYELHKPASAKPAEGLEVARMIGDINSDGNMQATADITMGGLPLSLGIVTIGDTYYIQTPPSQNWQSIPAASSPFGKLSLSAGTIQILDQITNPIYVGEQSKGGVNTYHITGQVTGQDLAAIVPTVDTTSQFATDVWIGVEDSYLYEVDVHGPATPEEPKGVWRSIVLSNLNVYVEIKAPI